MDIAYWIVAGLLALFYLYAGGLKVSSSKEGLAPMMAWAGTAVPMAGVRMIGVLELAGVAGLILPTLLDVASILTLFAAGGLLALQVLATGFHLARKETKDVWLNVGLVAVAALVMWLAATR